jgi:four helix bundle protein
MTTNKPYDIQERLEQFAARVVRYVERMPNTMAGRYFAGQLLRSGCSPPFHYGESQAAESNEDFIHKCKIAHKELKESRSNLNVQYLAELVSRADADLIWLRTECDELVKIMGKIISNAKGRGRI